MMNIFLFKFRNFRKLNFIIKKKILQILFLIKESNFETSLTYFINYLIIANLLFSSNTIIVTIYNFPFFPNKISDEKFFLILRRRNDSALIKSYKINTIYFTRDLT